MLYKLEPVEYASELTNKPVIVGAEHSDVQLFRVQRTDLNKRYMPSDEFTRAFASASEELQAAFSKAISQRD